MQDLSLLHYQAPSASTGSITRTCHRGSEKEAMFQQHGYRRAAKTGQRSWTLPALALQCLISHISQLATMVPPTKRAKQKAPNRIIIRGSERIVIPNTTEVNREKSSTA